MNISFKKVAVEHTDVIFDWLAKPHMIEFWDNSQEHKDDIRCFINSKKESIYYNGIYTYWIGFIDDIPYSFFLTSEISSSQSNIPELHRKYLSIVGKTITIDFGIGNEDFLGKNDLRLLPSTLILLIQRKIIAMCLPLEFYFLDNFPSFQLHLLNFL